MGINKVFLLLSLALLVHSNHYGQEILTNWKLEKQSEDIKISYRKVLVGDTFKTRQIKMTFMVSSDSKSVIALFKDSEKLTTWTAGAEKCRVLNDEAENSWIIYTLYDIPWPFEQRDLVTKCHLKENDSVTIIHLTSVPQQIPYYQGVSREEKFEGQWKFTELNNGNTEVEFTSISFTKSAVPRFIQDPFVQGILIESANELKSLAKQQYYAQISRL